MKKLFISTFCLLSITNCVFSQSEKRSCSIGLDYVWGNHYKGFPMLTLHTGKNKALKNIFLSIGGGSIESGKTTMDTEFSKDIIYLNPNENSIDKPYMRKSELAFIAGTTLYRNKSFDNKFEFNLNFIVGYYTVFSKGYTREYDIDNSYKSNPIQSSYRVFSVAETNYTERQSKFLSGLQLSFLYSFTEQISAHFSTSLGYVYTRSDRDISGKTFDNRGFFYYKYNYNEKNSSANFETIFPVMIGLRLSL